MKRTQSVIVRLLAAAGVAAALGTSASAQLSTPLMLSSTDASAGSPINVFDIATGQYNGFLPISSNLRITGMAYDQGSRKVYILVRGVPTTQSLLYSMDVNPLAEPFQISPVNGAATNITSGGLAWDGANNRLIGNILGRVVSIDPNTATTSDMFTYVGQASFNALDIDPVSGSLYLVNNSATVAGPFNGYGVYRIDPPYESSPVIKIKNAPLRQGVTETDIDGLAAGNGTLYLTTDEVLSTYRLNLSDLNYQSAVDQPTPGSGALVGGAAYVGSDDAGPDIGVAIRNDAENVVPPTGHAPFLVHVRNIGSQDANNVVVQVPLPGGTSFVSAAGGATFGGGVVSLNAGTLTPGQGTSFTLTLSSAAPFTATATATTTSADVYAGNNSASVLSTAGQPDLAVKVTAPANCTTAIGQETQFNIAVLNAGPRASNTTLSFPIPAGATFVSSSPTGVVSSGTVTINLGALNAGASTNVSVNMTPGNGLYFGLTATATSTNSTDANPIDNTNTGSTVSGLFTSAPIKAFVSTVPGNANSSLPGMAGNLNGTGTLDMLRSANGQWITADMDTDAGTAQNEVVVVTNVVTGVSTVLAQEGTTPLENGFTPAFTFLTPGVNNSGATSWSGRDNNPDVNADAYAAKVVNGNLSIVAREGQAVPAIPGARYGGTMSGGGITNSGGSIFVASLLDTPSAAENEAALVADGTISVAQKGITIPAGANGPLTDILNVGFYISADGTRYMYQGTTNTGGSRTVAVVGTVGQNDATAIVVSQQTLPGFSSPVNAVESTVMTPEGRWLVRGSNADGEDWVITGTDNSVSSGSLVMRTGPGTSTTPFVGPSVPITPGSTEMWDPSIATATVNNLIACAANPRGDIVVAGLTNGDTRANVVVVLNGETVIAREGDPIDANGNGLFDDEMYLADINFEDQLVLTNDACYALVKMRNREAVCTNATATTAWAVVRIPLPEQACPGDFNNSGSVTADDIFAFLDAWFAQNGQSGPGLTADVNNSGSVTADDIFAFLDLWFANNGSTCQ